MVNYWADQKVASKVELMAEKKESKKEKNLGDSTDLKKVVMKVSMMETNKVAQSDDQPVETKERV